MKKTTYTAVLAAIAVAGFTGVEKIPCVGVPVGIGESERNFRRFRRNRIADFSVKIDELLVSRADDFRRYSGGKVFVNKRRSRASGMDRRRRFFGFRSRRRFRVDRSRSQRKCRRTDVESAR
ncbi:MAG: hypothetical protein IJY80_06910 [Opitutales bacterium]|nr:hypothetical protein [Opitutales bacterium]